MIITLREDKKEFPIGVTPAEIARSISDGLFRASLVAKVNDKVVGMYEPINADATVEFLTFDTEEEEIRTIHLIEPVIKDYMAYLDNTTATKDKPFIISEIGAAALYGNKDRFRARWTEGYQADHLEEVIRIVRENTRINGVALWMFSDTRTGMQGRVLRRPRGYNNKGVFDEHRNPKEAVCVVTQGFKKYLNKER